MNGMQEGRIKKHLDKPYQLVENGEVLPMGSTVREVIENAVKKGWVITVEDVPKYAQATRKAFNRMTEQEQVEYDRKQEERKLEYQLRKPGEELGYWAVTKISYDYFMSLKEGVGL